MNAEILLKHFDRVSDSPDAVPRLRQFVLDLAVRGKLVEQDQTDEPASTLLRRIHAEKARLQSVGRIVPAKSNSTLPKHLSFDLRPGWEAARLGDVLLELQTGPFGSSLHQSDYRKGGVPVINPASIQNGQIVPIDTMAVGPETLERLATFKLRAADIVLARRGEMGRCAVVTEREVGWLCGTGCLVLRLPQNVYPQFFTMLIGSPLVRSYLSGSAVGATMQNLNQSILLTLVVGVPPKAEQHRIVAKVHELMVLCDQLAEAQKDREVRRDRLTVASLHQLSNGVAGDELRAHARFFINQLAKATNRPDQIKLLRGTILDLAARGCVVPQDAHDGSATDSLKQIQSEREDLVEQGRLRPDKSISPIDPGDTPFKLPASWSWVRVGQASLFTEYGTSHQSAHGDAGVPVLKMGDIQDGHVILGGQKKVPASIDDLPALYLKKYDLLYNRTNSAELVGKTGIYLGEDHEYTFASYLIRIRFSTNASDPQFFNFAMSAPYFRGTQIVPHLKQQCGQANVNGTVLKGMLVPFPPVAEQRRIVTKVEKLMSLCDQLEARLSTARAEVSRLLEAVLYEALGSGSRQNDGPSIAASLKGRPLAASEGLRCESERTLGAIE
jgi:type I restriction enzyme S subunit